MRVVKAFAQEERQLRRFDGAHPARVRPVDGLDAAARLLLPLHRLPAPARAGRAAVRRRQAGDRRQLSEGDFVAFYGYVLMLTSPMRMLGMALGMAQRAVASGERVFELLDRAPRLTAAPDAPPLPAGGGRVELRDVTLRATTAHEPVLRGIDLEVEPGQHRRDRGPDRLGQDHAGDADPAPLRRGRGRGAGRRRRRARRRPRLAAARGGDRLGRRVPVLGLAARQHRLRAAGGRRRRGRGRGRAGRAGASCSRTCPTGSTRSSASAG